MIDTGAWELDYLTTGDCSTVQSKLLLIRRRPTCDRRCQVTCWRVGKVLLTFGSTPVGLGSLTCARAKRIALAEWGFEYVAGRPPPGTRPTEPLVSFRSYRQLSGKNFSPLDDPRFQGALPANPPFSPPEGNSACRHDGVAVE